MTQHDDFDDADALPNLDAEALPNLDVEALPNLDEAALPNRADREPPQGACTAPVVVDFDAARLPSTEAALVLMASAMDRQASDRAGTLKGLAEGRSDEFQVNPYLLRVRPGWNARDMSTPDNQRHIDTLAQSIAEVGVKQTLTIVMEDGHPYVTDGHCRLLATYRAVEVYGADLRTVTVKCENRYASEADQILSQIVRNAGKGLSPMEKGIVYKKLIDLGWPVNDIARKVGETRENVNALLALQAAPAKIRRLVLDGRLSATLAMERIKAEGVAAASATLQKAVDIAAAAGCARATNRHVVEALPPRPQSPLVGLRALLARVLPAAEPDRQGFVTIRMDAIHFQKLKALAS